MNPSLEAAADSPSEMELFVELLARHDDGLTAYVLTLVPSLSDAKDILQETKVALWKSFAKFEKGTNFGAWARRTALHRVLDYRKRKGRESQRLWFTDECYELLSDDFETDHENREKQRLRLRECVAKLRPEHREIVALRYFKDASIEDVAAQVGRTVAAAYRVLSRIRLQLRKCLITSNTASS